MCSPNQIPINFRDRTQYPGLKNHNTSTPLQSMEPLLTSRCGPTRLNCLIPRNTLLLYPFSKHGKMLIFETVLVFSSRDLLTNVPPENLWGDRI